MLLSPGISVSKHVMTNNKLFQVVNLMGTDLLRHQPLWKDSLREIRELMAHVETQVRTILALHTLY